jgi:hypothetical protein
MERVHINFFFDLVGCISCVNGGFEIKLTGLYTYLFAFCNQSAIMFVVMIDLLCNCRHLWLLCSAT